MLRRFRSGVKWPHVWCCLVEQTGRYTILCHHRFVSRYRHLLKHIRRSVAYKAFTPVFKTSVQPAAFNQRTNRMKWGGKQCRSLLFNTPKTLCISWEQFDIQPDASLSYAAFYFACLLNSFFYLSVCYQCTLFSEQWNHQFELPKMQSNDLRQQ